MRMRCVFETAPAFLPAMTSDSRYVAARTMTSQGPDAGRASIADWIVVYCAEPRASTINSHRALAAIADAPGRTATDAIAIPTITATPTRLIPPSCLLLRRVVLLTVIHGGALRAVRHADLDGAGTARVVRVGRR